MASEETVRRKAALAVFDPCAAREEKEILRRRAAVLKQTGEPSWN
jgi:hypothetical protein